MWADLYPDSFLTQQYMQQGADLHMAQLMPLPLTVSRFSKIQIGFTFLVPAYPGNHGKRAIKQVCVRMRVQYINSLLTLLTYLQIMRQCTKSPVYTRTSAHTGLQVLAFCIISLVYLISLKVLDSNR